jgi:lysophospholipase L1-like esterase
MFYFVRKYSNTNIVLIDIPHRHDLWKHDKRNLSIQAYNNELKNIASIFQHVSLVETSLDWRFFTRHGFHLNRAGKECLAKQITGQIELLVKLLRKDSHTLNLKWKEETVSLNKNNNVTNSPPQSREDRSHC